MYRVRDWVRDSGVALYDWFHIFVSASSLGCIRFIGGSRGEKIVPRMFCLF